VGKNRSVRTLGGNSKRGILKGEEDSLSRSEQKQEVMGAWKRDKRRMGVPPLKAHAIEKK